MFRIIIFIFAAIKFMLAIQKETKTLPEQQSSEIAKAIEKIAFFTQWPKNHEKGDLKDHFVITVIGDNNLSNAILSYYKDKEIKDKTVKVNYVDVNSLPELKASELKENHIIFIPAISDENLSEFLKKISEVPVLTMSNTSGFAEKGVILNFYETNNKMPFEVNFNCLKKSGIYINALLLENIKIVEPIKN